MAGPGPRTHRQPEYSRWRFWTGAAGRWELLSERGNPLPPLGQASHTPRRQSGPWSSGGGSSGVASAVAAAGLLGNVLS